VNAILDSVAFYDIKLDYNKQLSLPDSVKAKMLLALGKQLPKKFIYDMKKRFEKDQDLVNYYKKLAKKIKQRDTLRDFKTIYDSLVLVRIKKNENYILVNNCIPSSLVLACGSWGVAEALPLLRHYLDDSTTCVSHYFILAAMARLGDNWAFDELLRRSHLNYWVEKHVVDTVSWNIKYEDLSKVLQLLRDINSMSYYLKSKELLLCAPDFLKVKGRVLLQFSGLEPSYSLAITQLCVELNCFQFKDKKSWDLILGPYWKNISKIGFNETSKMEKQKIWNEFLSDSYIKKITDELKEWIKVNVEF
jgi:hypothetical protein